MFSRDEILEEYKQDPNCFLMNGRWIYHGPISKDATNIIALRAYRAWTYQGDRCNNPKNKAYPSYGALGVKREWSSKDFTNWYLNKILTRDKWSKPCVARDQDKGNYTLENCELVELSENSKDSSSGRIKKEDIINFIRKSKENDVLNFKKQLIEFILGV